jgi:inosine-uridine nucleoside N-ribohydrolase
MDRTRVIVDCDPGHDDAIAILLAAASPAIELAAITTVAGNQTLAKTTLNARRVCTVAGIDDVPIAAGCERPLVREQIVAADIHGPSGLDGPAWGEARVPLDERHAVDLIIDEVRRSKGATTLVPVGPLTNIATALQREPAIASGIRRIALMGGAIGVGNHTPSAEFNIHADPEAAEIVFASGIPITMAPLEVTHRAAATEPILARIKAIGTPVADMAIALMRFFRDAYERTFGLPSPPLHDPCAVAWVIDPSLVVTRALNVVIDARPGITYGRTICDLYGKTKLPPNADVGVDLDVERFWDVVIDALGRYRSNADPLTSEPAPGLRGRDALLPGSAAGATGDGDLAANGPRAHARPGAGGRTALEAGLHHPWAAGAAGSLVSGSALER